MGLNINPFQNLFMQQQAVQGVGPRVQGQNPQVTSAQPKAVGTAGFEGATKASPMLNQQTSGLSFAGRNGVEGGVTVTGQMGREAGVAGKKLNLIA